MKHNLLRVYHLAMCWTFKRLAPQSTTFFSVRAVCFCWQQFQRQETIYHSLKMSTWSSNLQKHRQLLLASESLSIWAYKLGLVTWVKDGSITLSTDCSLAGENPHSIQPGFPVSWQTSQLQWLLWLPAGFPAASSIIFRQAKFKR